MARKPCAGPLSPRKIVFVIESDSGKMFWIRTSNNARQSTVGMFYIAVTPVVLLTQDSDLRGSNVVPDRPNASLHNAWTGYFFYRPLSSSLNVLYRPTQCLGSKILLPVKVPPDSQALALFTSECVFFESSFTLSMTVLLSVTWRRARWEQFRLFRDSLLTIFVKLIPVSNYSLFLIFFSF